MAHKTLISGTAYSVTGGRELIGGTGYDCKAGKTLIGGTAFTVPFSKGIPLNTITPGAILYLNESGSPVPFYIAKHDYESGLNGTGRTLVVRRDCYSECAFGDDGENKYAYGALNSFLNNTYLKLFDTGIRTAIGTTKFYYTPGGGTPSVSTLQKAIFQLSLTELGKTGSNANKEGTTLPIASTLQKAKMNGSAAAQWTRTPKNSNSISAFYLNENGNPGSITCTYTFGSRPAFTLPATTAVVANADGTYTIAA